MIGFVSAISSALAVIILVVLASLIGFVQSIMPETGLIKLSDTKYRYVMESTYITTDMIRNLVIQSELIDIGKHVTSYQTGCNYGFNADERQMTEIPTYNFIILGQYFDGSVAIDPIYIYEENEAFNTCFIDINLSDVEKDEQGDK